MMDHDTLMPPFLGISHLEGFSQYIYAMGKESSFLERLHAGIWIIRVSFGWVGKGREEVAWGYC